MLFQVVFLLLSMNWIDHVHSHSWLECTNYDVTAPNHLYYNPRSCSGFARCGTRQAVEGFGVDTGFDFRPLLHARSCQCLKNDSHAYSSKAPMATYSPGQKVCLAYPSKNHVADICTNQYIPDTGVRIFRTTSSPTAIDPVLNQWPLQYRHENGNHSLGTIDYKGFQNCPKFCEDKGRALCTLCFQLESDLAPGQYTFQWQWEFNSADDVYSTCWEAEVK